MKISDKHKLFCEKYILEPHAENAYCEAYKVARGRTAMSNGWKLLQRQDVQEYLAFLRQKLQKKFDITAERVLSEYAKIAFSDVKDFVNGGNNILELKFLDNEKTAAVAGVDVAVSDGGTVSKKLRLHNKTEALNALAKHLGLFERDNSQRDKTIKVVIK